MPFAAWNWVAVIILDVLLRAASVIFPLFMLLVLPWSILHLGMLMSISAYVRTFDLEPRTAMLRTLRWTNGLFAVIYVAAQVHFNWRGRVTSCAYDTCSWVNGAVTWPGVGTLAAQTLVQIGINLLPVAMVLAFLARRHDPATA